MGPRRSAVHVGRSRGATARAGLPTPGVAGWGAMGPVALDTVKTVARAMTLFVLLAPVAAACGHSGSGRSQGDRRVAVDVDTGHVPGMLDLDRVAGMQIPGR